METEGGEKMKSMKMQKSSASGYAMTSVTASIIGWWILGIILIPVALISGILAFVKGKRQPLSKKDKIAASIGIVLSLIQIVWPIVIAVNAANTV